MMKTLDKETINTQLGKDVKEWLAMNGLELDARVFFNGNMYEWSSPDKAWASTEGVISDYCPYSKEGTVAMTFEGTLYDLIHYYPESHPILEGLDKVFEKHGYFYELGHTWSLSADTINGD